MAAASYSTALSRRAPSSSGATNESPGGDPSGLFCCALRVAAGVRRGDPKDRPGDKHANSAAGDTDQDRQTTWGHLPALVPS